MKELKPCPFCGSAEVNRTTDPTPDDDGWYTLVCPDCICVSPLANSLESCIEAWNARADGWVSVDDELPELNAHCIIYSTRKGFKPTNISVTDHSIFLKI